MSFDVNRYLSKIGVQKKEPTFQYLSELTLGHILSVPVENLFIHYANKVRLDIDDLFDHLIKNNRGGNHLHLNVLFNHLLTALGFDAYLISARKSQTDKPHSNVLSIVQLDGHKYLADVASASHLRQPILLTSNQPSLDFTQYVKCECSDEVIKLQVSSDLAHYNTILEFQDFPIRLIEFLDMNDYLQSSALEKGQKYIRKLTVEGWVELTHRSLHIVSRNNRQEYSVDHEDDFLAKLNQHFGLSIQDLTQ